MQTVTPNRRRPVQFTKHHLDWDNLPAATEGRMQGFAADNPRLYLNPEYTLVCPPEVPLDVFITQARRAQVLWNMRLARQFGSTERKRRIKTADFRLVLAEDGNHTVERHVPAVPFVRVTNQCHLCM